MWKTIVRFGAGAEFLWAIYGYISRLIWESGEVIGNLEISPRLAQELYLLAAVLGAATLLALSWEAIKRPLCDWWFADHIATEEKRVRLRGLLEHFAYNQYDRTADLIYLGTVLAEFGWKLDVSRNERENSRILAQLAVKHMDDGNFDELNNLFLSTKEGP